LEVRFANALRRPLLFWNEEVVEKQLPKVAAYGKSNFFWTTIVVLGGCLLLKYFYRTDLATLVGS